MYETYLKLSANELHNRLVQRKLHDSEIQRIKQEVSDLKETMRVARITRTQRQTEWDKLLQPLRYEINNARVGLRYNGEEAPQPERQAAFGAYIALMEKLLAMLDAPSKALEYTPTQIAQAKNLPNDGSHWTDWIPAHKKAPVADLFILIPKTPRGKRKIPFQRTTTPEHNAKARTRLFNKTSKEISNLERKIALNPTDKRIAQLEQMQHALKIIEMLSNNEAVPTSWTKLEGVRTTSV